MGQEGNETTIVSVEFEVYGHVQGVYFTKYCKELADKLAMGGWVKNTKNGTIVGKIQGDKQNMDEVVQWLTRTGSPGCKIERVEFRNWESMSRPEFRNFSLRF